MLIIQIALGVFIGQMARACVLGYIEYQWKHKCGGQSTLWDNIRLVM